MNCSNLVVVRQVSSSLESMIQSLPSSHSAEHSRNEPSHSFRIVDEMNQGMNAHKERTLFNYKRRQKMITMKATKTKTKPYEIGGVWLLLPNLAVDHPGWR